MKRVRKLVMVALIAPTLALAAPAVSASASCSVSSHLSQGRRGSDQVRCLQTTLNDQGFNAGPVDGWFGPVTRAAVVAFQQAKGLHVDGWVGPQTAGSLGVWTTPAVFARRSTAAVGGSSSGWSVNWDRVAHCESGGQWSHGQVRNRFGTFSGGLMIMNSAWRQFGGTQFASIAGNASKAQQIVVAERIAARVGFNAAWQCHA